MNLELAIEAAVGRRPRRLVPLAGGCVGEVYRAEFEVGDPLVAKIDQASSATLEIEGAMLVDLAPYLPVPAVVHSAPELLLMEWMSGSSSFTSPAEQHAAELLAALHGVTAEEFGYERGTLIGGLYQPNPRTTTWLEFFAERRLIYMAREAHSHGTVDRVCAFAADLAEFLAEPSAPSLLHGDVWSGNVLADNGRITAFLDPAIYFGHPEVELAFITMFSTFGDRFFEAYRALSRIDPGFMSERRHAYNLYPNLVHARLFGGSYVRSVENILARFGC